MTQREEDQMASRSQPCADASALARTTSGTWGYRGWLIGLEPDNQWHATSPNYDASYEGPEDGWVDNGEKVEAATLKDVCDEIDFWIEEHS